MALHEILGSGVIYRGFPKHRCARSAIPSRASTRLPSSIGNPPRPGPPPMFPRMRESTVHAVHHHKAEPHAVCSPAPPPGPARPSGPRRMRHRAEQGQYIEPVPALVFLYTCLISFKKAQGRRPDHMSENWLQFIPAVPEFRPTPEDAERARLLLASFVPRADKVSVTFPDHIEFFHPGGNWSGVECPACGADAEPWWNLAVGVASEGRFVNLEVRAECCGASVFLNEMRYVWPAVFGRFALEALNPDVRDLSPAQELQLQQALGCSLRKVWVHL